MAFFFGFLEKKNTDSPINYWIAIWLYCRSGKCMKIRIMVGLIKICVNMDEEKSREKRRGERGRGKRKKKKERKMSIDIGLVCGSYKQLKNIE